LIYALHKSHMNQFHIKKNKIEISIIWNSPPFTPKKEEIIIAFKIFMWGGNWFFILRGFLFREKFSIFFVLILYSNWYPIKFIFSTKEFILIGKILLIGMTWIDIDMFRFMNDALEILEQWSSNFFARGTLESPKFFGGTPKYVKMLK
jgi:hypothetical protein